MIRILVIILIINFTSCSEKKHFYSDKIIECVRLEDSSKNIFETLNQFEKYLIDEKVLKSNTYESYINMLNEMENSNIDPIKIIGFYDKNSYLFTPSLYAQLDECIKKNSFYDTKLNNVLHEMISEGFMSHIKGSSYDLSILEKISEKEFSLPIVKYITLYYIINYFYL